MQWKAGNQGKLMEGNQVNQVKHMDGITPPRMGKNVGSGYETTQFNSNPPPISQYPHKLNIHSKNPPNPYAIGLNKMVNSKYEYR